MLSGVNKLVSNRSVTKDARFVHLQELIAPSKKRIADAKVAAKKQVAEQIAAERAVLLGAVRWAKTQGLSDYAIGVATGFTSGPAKAALLAEAFGEDTLALVAAKAGVPLVVFEHEGWRAVFTKTWPWNVNGYITCDWQVSYGDKEFTFHNNEAQWWCTPASAMEFIHDGSMPDEIFRPLCDFKPDNG